MNFLFVLEKPFCAPEIGFTSVLFVRESWKDIQIQGFCIHQSKDPYLIPLFFWEHYRQTTTELDLHAKQFPLYTSFQGRRDKRAESQQSSLNAASAAAAGFS
jgi:hypothetical protein